MLLRREYIQPNAKKNRSLRVKTLCIAQRQSLTLVAVWKQAKKQRALSQTPQHYRTNESIATQPCTKSLKTIPKQICFVYLLTMMVCMCFGGERVRAEIEKQRHGNNNNTMVSPPLRRNCPASFRESAHFFSTFCFPVLFFLCFKFFKLFCNKQKKSVLRK